MFALRSRGAGPVLSLATKAMARQRQLNQSVRRSAEPKTPSAYVLEPQRTSLATGRFPPDLPQEAMYVNTSPLEYSQLGAKYLEAGTLGNGVRLSWDPKLRQTSISRYPTPAHAAIIETCSIAFDHSLLKYNATNAFRVARSTTDEIGPSGDYPLPTNMISDIRVDQLGPDGKQMPAVVFIVGFSETYDSLRESARLWLQNTTVKQVVLFKVVERPIFCPPLFPSDYPDRASIPIPEKIKYFDFKTQPNVPQGELMLNNKLWVGRLQAYWEVWGTNVNGEMTPKSPRSHFYGDNQADDASLKLRYRDFARAGPDIDDAPNVDIKNGLLRYELEYSRRELGRLRCYRFINTCLRRNQSQQKQ